MMLFPAVLMNFPNSKICLIGEWSIEIRKDKNIFMLNSSKQKVIFPFQHFHQALLDSHPCSLSKFESKFMLRALCEMINNV